MFENEFDFATYIKDVLESNNIKNFKDIKILKLYNILDSVNLIIRVDELEYLIFINEYSDKNHSPVLTSYNLYRWNENKKNLCGNWKHICLESYAIINRIEDETVH